ncbi:hypothetical protein T08_9227 [Trichinella sp. T8]|nr:hypothetical protein T08_9227 [Trichinella sp. T8]
MKNIISTDRTESYEPEGQKRGHVRSLEALDCAPECDCAIKLILTIGKRFLSTTILSIWEAKPLEMNDEKSSDRRTREKERHYAHSKGKTVNEDEGRSTNRQSSLNEGRSQKILCCV